MLRAYINLEHTDWDQHLPMAEFAYNNSINATTRFTPFYLNYGRHVLSPLDIAIAPARLIDNPDADARIHRLHADLQQARANIERAQQRQSHYVNQHRRDIKFEVGDTVLLSTEHLKLAGPDTQVAKFAHRYIGPFTIARKVNDNAYELNLPPTWRMHNVINISRLRPYHDGRQSFPSRPRSDSRPPPDSVDEDGNEVWEVERVLRQRQRGRRTEYLVKWLGYPDWEATWEPAAHLRTAPEVLERFHAAAASSHGSD
jgi:hypothetical protein